MHDITDLPAWERLFKKIVWKQLGDMEGKKILDFGTVDMENQIFKSLSICQMSAIRDICY